MPLIKPVLILFLLAIYFYYILRVDNPLWPRITGLAFLLVAVFFILFPDASSAVAGLFGVGRGVDFLFYFLFTFLLFIALIFYIRFIQLERQITELTRTIALLTARPAFRPPDEDTGE